MTTRTLVTAPARACRRAATPLLSSFLGTILTAGMLQAQTPYAYLPTASPQDGHFLSISGAGFQTLAGDITMKIASPSTASSVEIGIFDGETSGMWDFGNVVLTYTLYADPNADGSGTQQVAQWSGSAMPDNAWFSATVTNDASARGVNGDYFYILKATTPNPGASYLSVFKVRTNGTVAVTGSQPFAYIAPLNSLADAQTIYPNYPTLTPTTYDGGWSFYLDVFRPQTSLDLWDGDMDYGKYDCSENDSDDPDTPNEIPSFSVGSAAVAEGVAGNGVPCMNASGVVTGGYTTSNPPDDSQRPTSQRAPSVTYDVIDPNGVHYTNTNPSGNVEWERFRVSTDAFDRSRMDLHAASLPSGVYQVRITGVDMSNLNAWRFPFDALGVDSAGNPIAPIRPYKVHGTVFTDANGNGIQESGEGGIAGVRISIGTGTTATTDGSGNYSFKVEAGTYTVVLDSTTLASGATPASDYDGIATRNTAVVTVGPGQADVDVFFGYTAPPVGAGSGSYWTLHVGDWPLATITVGCTTYTKDQALAILLHADNGDRTYLLAAQLIAAKLNVAAGANPLCVATTITLADLWLCQNPLGTGGLLGWVTGLPLLNTLTDYNNGLLCVPAMH